MAGNYESHRLERSREAIHGDLAGWLDEWSARPSLRVYPRHWAGVIRTHEGIPFAERMYWSMIPSWLRDVTSDGAPRLEMSTHVARADTIGTAPIHRGAWQHARRCLIPMAAWYEPARRLGRDGWVRVATGDRIVTVAGLWDRWQPPGGEEIRGFTMITCEASAKLEPVGERMPIIIATADRERWLDAHASEESIAALLKPVNVEPLLSFAGTG